MLGNRTLTLWWICPEKRRVKRSHYQSNNFDYFINLTSNCSGQNRFYQSVFTKHRILMLHHIK